MGIYTFNILIDLCLKSQEIPGYIVINCHKPPEEMLYDVHREVNMLVDYRPNAKAPGHLRHIIHTQKMASQKEDAIPQK